MKQMDYGIYPYLKNTPTNYQKQVMNIIIHQSKSKRDLSTYLHTCAYALALSTFEKGTEMAILSHS